MHPNAGGHSAISILISEALPLLLSARRPSLPLPKPLHLKTSASSVEEASWQCRTCDWGAPNRWVRPNREPCRNLPAVPDLTLGFRVSGTHNAGHKGTPPANDASLPAPASSSKAEIERVEQLMKAELAARYNVTRPRNLAKQGWLGQRPGDTVAFVIHGGRLGARVMGAFLCSYENVGTASVRLLRGRPGGAEDEVLRAAPAFLLDLDCQWARRSSQQCLRYLGQSGPGDHLLFINVTSERSGLNQVMLVGLYTQSISRNDVQPELGLLTSLSGDVRPSNNASCVQRRSGCCSS